MPELILASASPRRRELLAQIGVDFRCCAVDIDESVHPGEAAEDYVERLAREKAEACQRLYPEAVVLGSDTSVVVAGRILGKPVDEEDAVRMLMMLSGRRHQVMTAVAVVAGRQCSVETVVTEVAFVELDEARCRAYWRTGEPCDKAGAYGIQGLGAVLVQEIRGSYSAVVGLPLMQTATLLQRYEVPVWQQS
ncbi:Maf family protein [Marinobacterium marinum]|uniref:dTTP/UTP pyrophosphatase n=1 Tax=Marinobacterium marinum TaxID=2756129 RepID=A0A7W1WZL8_9GAMM|nr:Maf family protein [Marinobacterium marinum]MBA4503131.1 septum formation inhibitor Maf [Marinobacterium marinum]